MGRPQLTGTTSTTSTINTMEQFRFRKWQVYQDSQKLFSDILGIVATLPSQYRYSLGDQMTRAALSIVLNIAEGSGKNSIKELNRFLDIAIGSAYETLACVDTLAQNKFITKEKLGSLERQVVSICSQIGGFKKKLRNPYTK